MTGDSSTPEPHSPVSRVADEEPGEAPRYEETVERGSGNEFTESISWRVRLSDNEPWKRWVIFGVAVLVFLFGTLVFRLLLGIVGSAMILGATAEFWLGTVFKLDEEGASSRTGLSYARILWKDVKRAVVTPIGVKLSPLEEATRLAPFRGVFLRYGGEDRVRIEGAVRRLGGNDVRFVEGTAD